MYSLAPIAEEVSSDDGSFADDDEGNSCVSEREDTDAVASYPMLPPPVSLFTPYPSLAVEKFMTEDDGTPIIDNNHESESKDGETADDANIPKPATASSSSTLWLARVSSRIFTDSSSAISSVASHIARASRFLTADSITEHLTSRDDEKMFPLAEFCQLIEEHASLERAKILSVECYKEPIQLGVVHRTLIFHLCREGRTDVWMRVDRRRSRKVSFPVFAIRGGRTEANDVALLAGSRESLLDRRPATLENRIEFKSPPNLGVFRFCLHIICEELLEYHLWPQNCWFMCSLLQEHLFEVGDGLFEHGQHVYPHLAPRVRARVRNRVYHLLPEPPSILDMLARLPISMRYNQPVASLRTLIADQDLRSPGSLTVEQVGSITQAIHNLHQIITSRQTNHNADIGATASHLLLHALSLERCSSDDGTPPDSSSRSKTLASYGKYVLSPGDLDPVRLHLLDMQREQYRASPDQHWEDLVFHLARTARNARNVDPILSRECVVEAQSIVNRHSFGPKSWIGSQVLEGHIFAVNCVAFSPNGKQIASASDDNTVRRWDALTGESVGEPMRGHTDWVRAVAFSPDGTQIVSGSHDESLRRWDASSGQPIGDPMQGHTGSVVSVAYSPDGKLIVSGSWDSTIRCWDAFTGEVVSKPLEGHTDFVRSVAFSPDGKRIVSGSDDQTIRLWDAITGEAVGEPWKGHTRAVYSVVFAPDGKFVVSGSWDDTVRRWNALTGESIGKPMTGHTGSVYCVAVSPDAKQIASGSYDNTIRLWDATSGELIGEPLKGHTRGVLSVAFSPDGRQIVSGGWDNTVRIWDSLEDLDRWTESE